MHAGASFNAVFRMRHNQPWLGRSKLPVGRNRELMRTRWYDALIEHEVALIFQWPVNS